MWKMNSSAKSIRNWTAILLAWLALAAFINFSQRKVDHLSEKLASAGDVPLIPDYRVMRFFAAGYEQLYADCWWLAFVQYIGDFRKRLLDHSEYSYQYLNLITQLDPHFTQPYWF